MRLSSMACCAFLIFSAKEARAADANLAVHPTEIVDADGSLSERIHALVASELVRRGFDLVPSGDVEKALATRGAGGCSALADQERTRCLAELARKTNARRAILFTVAPFAGDQVVITSLVVAHSGVVLQELPPYAHRRAPKGDPEAAIREALGAVVPRIDMHDPNAVDLTPLTTEPDPATASAATEPEVPTPPRRSTARRTAGFATAGAGLVLVGAGAFGLVRAHQRADELNALYQNGGVPTREQFAELRFAASSNQTLGFVGFGLGAATLAAGGFLIATSPKEPAPAASAWNWNVLIGPGHAALVVRFP